jgi:PHD/YefM family antitoxin component YafN of YafNO toxin-antitoxin module
MKKIPFFLFFLMLSMSSAMASTITDKASIVDLKNKVVAEHQKTVISNENQEQLLIIMPIRNYVA